MAPSSFKFKKSFNKICSKKQLFKRLPFLEWLPSYSLSKGISDAIAGITVGLTVIPQGIAYALVAELEPQYGLYSAFMSCFFYCIFGASPYACIGPTAILGLMTAQHTRGKPVDLVILLTFFTGIIITVLGGLQLGAIIDFISVPVIAGFSSAAALTIATTQLKGLFGLDLPANRSTNIHGTLGKWVEIANHMYTLRYEDTIMGITCIIVLLALRELKKVKWFEPIDPEDQVSVSYMRKQCNKMPLRLLNFMSKFIWLLSTAKNAVVVCICLAIAYACDPILPLDPNSKNTTFILTGEIETGLPNFKLPAFHTFTKEGNELSLVDMIQILGAGIIIIPLVSILQHIAVAVAFSSGAPVDASQEMIALGVCNIMGSFVGSMPLTSSFSRSAVNSSSGVQTPFGGIFTGILVILALAFLLPICSYIPKATLSAVIITAVIFMVEYEVVKPMYRSNKIDVFVALATFFCCLFWALEYGILLGVLIQAIFILYNSARPKIEIQEKTFSGPGTEYIWIHLDRALYYPSISYVRNLINKAALKQRVQSTPVVIDCSHIHGSDFTGAKGFEAMVSDFKKRGQPIFFINMSSKVERNLLGRGSDHLNVIKSTEELENHLTGIFPENRKLQNSEENSQAEDPLLR